MHKISYRIPEATEASGIRRSTLYKLMASGELEYFHIGRARFIPADALEEYIAKAREAA